MNTPFVSICIPTYQQPELFEKALISIFEQTYSNFEIIVTDDSIDDSIKKVVDKYNNDKRLKYYRNSVKKGAPENWNEAMRLANGEYIKILHHDDWLLNKDSLKIFVETALNNTDYDFIFSSCINHDDKGIIKNIRRPTKLQLNRIKSNPEVLFLSNKIGPPSATFFKNKNIMFDCKLKWLVDVDFYIKYLNKADICYINTPLIGITTYYDSQLTSKCFNNVNIEIKETIIVNSKLKEKKIMPYYQFKPLLYVFLKFKVNRDVLTRFVNKKLIDKNIINILCFTKIFPFKKGFRNISLHIKENFYKKLLNIIYRKIIINAYVDIAYLIYSGKAIIEKFYNKS